MDPASGFFKRFDFIFSYVFKSFELAPYCVWNKWSPAIFVLAFCFFCVLLIHSCWVISNGNNQSLYFVKTMFKMTIILFSEGLAISSLDRIVFRVSENGWFAKIFLENIKRDFLLKIFIRNNKQISKKKKTILLTENFSTYKLSQVKMLHTNLSSRNHRSRKLSTMSHRELELRAASFLKLQRSFHFFVNSHNTKTHINCHGDMWRWQFKTNTVSSLLVLSHH